MATQQHSLCESIMPLATQHSVRVSAADYLLQEKEQPMLWNPGSIRS